MGYCRSAYAYSPHRLGYEGLLFCSSVYDFLSHIVSIVDMNEGVKNVVQVMDAALLLFV